MNRKSKVINADVDFVRRIRNIFPYDSDTKRTKKISCMLDELEDKLKPELSDTKSDRMIKKMLR